MDCQREINKQNNKDLKKSINSIFGIKMQSKNKQQLCNQ